MKGFEHLKKPSKVDQKLAGKSYGAFVSVLGKIRSQQTEIEIAETAEKITIPMAALRFLGQILKSMGEGKLISIVPVATEVTTQAAAEVLGCSRPHLVKLLESGQIAFTKIGKHRRIKIDDILHYKHQLKNQQKKHLIDIMHADEETGLYDS